MSQIAQAVVLKAYEDEDLPRIEWDEKEPEILEVYIRLELEKKICLIMDRSFLNELNESMALNTAHK